MARKLHPNDKAPQRRWITIHQDHLDQGRMKEFVRSPRPVECSSRKLAEEFRGEPNYFEKNAERMRYPEFRRQHLFVGSGVIEAGCKTSDERILVGAGNHFYPASRFVLTYLFDDSPLPGAQVRGRFEILRASAWR